MLVLNVFFFFAVMFVNSSVHAMTYGNSRSASNTNSKPHAYDEKHSSSVHTLTKGLTRGDIGVKRPSKPILQKKKSKHTMLYAAIGISLGVASIASWYAPKDYVQTSLSSYALERPWLLTLAKSVWKGAYHIAWPSIMYCGYRLITSNVSGSEILQQVLGKTQELAGIEILTQNIAQNVEREQRFGKQLMQKVNKHTVQINKQRYRITQKKKQFSIKHQNIVKGTRRQIESTEFYKLKIQEISGQIDTLLEDKRRANKFMQLE